MTDELFNHPVFNGAAAEPDWHLDDRGQPEQPGVGEDDSGREIYTDVAALLDGTLPEPPSPVLLRRTDGCALLYGGRVNLLFGDPETGKTWIALAACAEALRADRRVLVVDMDHNGAESVIGNLLLLGAPRAALRDRMQFRHCEPDDHGEVFSVVEQSKIWRPAVALVDSLGELLHVVGASSNSPDDYTGANRSVLQPLANVGAAVIAIDHLAQNQTSRAIGPTGTLAKRRAIGGASIRVKVGRQFVPGKGGSALLIVNKDRHGGVRRNCPSGERDPLAGTFVMDAPDSHGAVGWRVIPPLELTTATELEDKTTEFLAAVRAIEASDFTAKDAARQLSGDDPPTSGQIKQAAYHLDRLTDSGLLEQVSQGRRGGGPSKWRLGETAGQGNPKSESLFGDSPNPTPNPNKSETS
ncbi:hypothetical protein BOH72_23365 [Mycobacterium sp. WY10]|nr:hypothetical protein BOH72_23365 [Mycobacterium sp. WY10]